MSVPYIDPQKRERQRRKKIAKIQQRERELKEKTKKRETRYCATCAMPFWCPPGSARRHCLDHGNIEG